MDRREEDVKTCSPKASPYDGLLICIVNICSVARKGGLRDNWGESGSQRIQEKKENHYYMEGHHEPFAVKFRFGYVSETNPYIPNVRFLIQQR
jgi:hypothetical protein